MNWFNNRKIGVKVFLSCFVFLLLIGSISFQGITSVNAADEAFQTFYADRFVPVRELNLIFKGLLQVRINMLQEKIAVQLNNMNEFEKRLKSSGKIHDVNWKKWDEYMKTKMDEEEKKLADAFAANYKNIQSIAKEFVAALRKKDIEGSGVVSDRWVKVYRESRENMDKLIGLQQRIGEQLRDEQESSAASVLMLSIIFLSVAVFMGIIITVVLSRSVKNPVQKGLEFAQSFAKGDLTARIDLDQKDELGNLADSLNKAADNLEQLISNVIDTSQSLVQVVEQIAAGNQNLSQRTSEQASSLEEIASTIEETTATINQNADNTNEANKLSDNSRMLADEGNNVVEDAVGAMNEINVSSKKIGEIIGVINEISFQTNLLALNAAVEAARAGDAGRGFAVVAGEVRNLAQRSSSASKEIEQLINDSIEKIGRGTELSNKSGEALKEVKQSIDSLGKIISEIAAASQEQRQGVGQVNTAVTEMDTMTQQNASLVEETASASEEMSNQAQDLLSMVEKFKISGALVGDTTKTTKLAQQQTKIHLKAARQVQAQHTKVDAGNGGKGAPAAIQAKKADEAHAAPRASNPDLKELMTEEGFDEF